LITVDLYLALGLAILLAPGVYYAFKKNFFVIFSKKLNCFPVQLFFTIPFFLGLGLGLSILIPAFFALFIPSGFDLARQTFGSYAYLIIPAISSIIIIFGFNNYIVEKNEKSLNELEDFELFAYFPKQVYRNFGEKMHDTAFIYPKRTKGDLLIGTQKSDLIIDPKELNGIDIAFTFNGEIIINEINLQKLSNAELTGFTTRPIQNYKSMTKNNNYSQLLPTSTMTKMNEKTKIIYRHWISASKIIGENRIYYNKNVLETMSDFNQSLEAFGYEDKRHFRLPQKYWIVSKKARSILIDELGQQDYDFIPIHLVDDE